MAPIISKEAQNRRRSSSINPICLLVLYSSIKEFMVVIYGPTTVSCPKVGPSVTLWPASLDLGCSIIVPALVNESPPMVVTLNIIVRPGL
ncbi:hypothetical protein BYT27DRAFT_7185031 [Phlegmacium glaucopus]|nr:hypothetical protein BYT27DRAFT_7185031 [Phlegmacium glaucopus]